ncbi:hypothetical protein [Bradyrhizobium sp. ERR14]|uniref:hypothetical protein n=1 Tax=Bradyrhizobium sp. ERR14 TaxID=2663837 RepID=UPI00161557F0|nr:hypothetical protein [Bradyrhizobium sp. ERR14]MBB4391776.1 hypothetical protein [Bradyrhizobium sp. ERR14]
MASTIQTFLGELPDSLLPRIRTGFDALSKLSAPDRSAVVAKFLDSFQRTGDLDRDWLDSTVSISRIEASAILAALSVSVGVLSQTEGTPEDFVQAARGKLFDDSAIRAAQEAASIIASERPRISDTIERRTLSAQTLPALESFDVSVDFRFGFDKNNEIKSGVPVALVHVDTDARAELFLQMSRSDVEMLVEKLNTVLKQMDAAVKAFAKTDVFK